MPEIGSLLDGRRTRQAIKETHQYMQEHDISPEEASHFADWAEEQGLADE
jgi:hypothetical protein